MSPIELQKRRTLVRLTIAALGVCIGVLGTVGRAAAESRHVCAQIKGALTSKDPARYSVPFEQPDPEQLIYRLDIDKNGVDDRLEASCGNGLDATCEMRLSMNGKANIEFSLPASVRVMEIERRLYIVTGVTIHGDGKISQRHFAVHELRPGALKNMNCGKL